ncbi:hypothetical protein [Natronobacterium gregoryi]|uniref:hypothetical protein n=1 Tax=Natronobacterium gregoryi TaxID=44930 RepID=UPI0012DECDD8|nr:hypothetical protein [Natronobacterium gregoryi]
MLLEFGYGTVFVSRIDATIGLGVATEVGRSLAVVQRGCCRSAYCCCSDVSATSRKR